MRIKHPRQGWPLALAVLIFLATAIYAVAGVLGAPYLWRFGGEHLIPVGAGLVASGICVRAWWTGFWF